MLKLLIIGIALWSSTANAKAYRTAYDYAFCDAIAEEVISWRKPCATDATCKDQIEAQQVIQRMMKLKTAVEQTAYSKGISPSDFDAAKSEKTLWIQNELRSTTSFDIESFREWINLSVEVCARDFYLPKN